MTRCLLITDDEQKAVIVWDMPIVGEPSVDQQRLASKVVTLSPTLVLHYHPWWGTQNVRAVALARAYGAETHQRTSGPVIVTGPIGWDSGPSDVPDGLVELLLHPGTVVVQMRCGGAWATRTDGLSVWEAFEAMADMARRCIPARVVVPRETENQ